MTEPRKKIAILGGGMGGIGTALELTHPDNPDRDRYDITVYQLGWRLGGKGASGRNMEPGGGKRIEEHGVHILLGFYENTFHLFRQVMKEWEIPDGHPWATPMRADRWTRAFTPCFYAPVLQPSRSGGWVEWPMVFPVQPGTPGDGRPPRTRPWQAAAALFRWINVLFGMMEGEAMPAGNVGRWVPTTDAAALAAGRTPSGPLQIGRALFNLGRLLGTGLRLRGPGGARRRAEPLDTEDQNGAALLRALSDIGLALAWGLLRNAWGVGTRGFDALDRYDLREFLGRYGASPASLASPVLDTLYDSMYASVGGTSRDEDKNLAAGAALRSFLHILLNYKGAPWWKMNAGMGDTLFAPAYEVLRQRGVKFKFFHRVRELGLSADRRRVERITIGRQAQIVDPATGAPRPDTEYDPLVPVNVRDRTGRPFPEPLQCWPNAPRYEQLAQGKELLARRVNFESYDAKWNDIETLTLKKGEDFDHVVYAISIGAFPEICRELGEASERLRRMSEQTLTVPTEAYQVWLSKTIEALGWTKPSPVLGNFVDPLNTWADMTHLSPAEEFDVGQAPASIAYFCGAMPDTVSDRETFAHVKADAARLLDQMAVHLWPAAAGREGGFDPSLKLHEYHRTTLIPSDRYVLTVAGSTAHRVWPYETGFPNLTFAGDWTRNVLNLGTVEAAVVSARLASHAISGYPRKRDIARYRSR